ncbi:MAG: response regulator transcription factor [Flavobacteriaceae bacterium]|nr:response regulator transcription factor [Flavobacteriaceae bacterium]
MLVKCMIIDDEQPAIELLEKYISTLPDLEVVATCYSAIEASEILKKQSVDLLFLDIQMPLLTGLEFLKNSKDLPKAILTTAHREYAIEGYDLDIVDYLLKPISFERFFKAVQRYYQNSKRKNITLKSISERNHIYVNVNKKQHKVNFDSILYVESLKDYIRIHTSTKSLVVRINIGSILQELPSSQFVRVHRSYIVSKNKITAYTSSDIEIGAIEIPIGQTYKGVVDELCKP